MDIEDTDKMSLVKIKERWDEKMFRYIINNMKYLGA